MNKHSVFEWATTYIDVGFVLRDWFKYTNMPPWNIMFTNKNTCVFLELKDVKYCWPLAKLYNFWNYTLNTERRIRVARWSLPTQGCMGWAMSMWRKPAIVLDL